MRRLQCSSCRNKEESLSLCVNPSFVTRQPLGNHIPMKKKICWNFRFLCSPWCAKDGHRISRHFPALSLFRLVPELLKIDSVTSEMLAELCGLKLSSTEYDIFNGWGTARYICIKRTLLLLSYLIMYTRERKSLKVLNLYSDRTSYVKVRFSQSLQVNTDNSIQFNSILYYLCAESTATRPITDTAQYKHT
jgi:hypothetical protein